MGRFTLEELECDEIHAALKDRQGELTKKVSKLEDEGLPEAAEGVRMRLRLYDSHEGPGGTARAGLVRMFAPQRDIESEAEQARRNAGEARNPKGQQDMFGGGAETGGRPRGAAASVPSDNAGAEIVDVDFEIIPEGRRIGAKSTLTIESALAILAQVGRILLAGPAAITDDEFDNYARAVVAVLPAMNPAMDPEHVRAHVMDELRAADDRAHGLAHYVNRNVDAIRDLRENPPAPKSDTEPKFVPLDDEELADLDDDERKEYDAAKAKAEAAIDAANARGELAQVESIEQPLSDAAAAALRAVVFPTPTPAEGSDGRDADGGLSFETPNTAGETNGTEAGTKPAEGETKPAEGGTTNEASDALDKGAKKKARKRGKPKGEK